MNLKKYNALTERDREIFDQAAADVMVWTDLEMSVSHKKEREDILSKGGKVYDLSPAERGLYQKSAYEMWPELRKASGPVGNKLADILEKYRER
jgi:TRAP-type C4-dicarboxylate transport system substrate-binding protein